MSTIENKTANEVITINISDDYHKSKLKEGQLGIMNNGLYSWVNGKWEMIKQTSSSLTELCEHCKYNDSGYCSRLFDSWGARISTNSISYCGFFELS